MVIAIVGLAAMAVSIVMFLSHIRRQGFWQRPVLTAFVIFGALNITMLFGAPVYMFFAGECASGWPILVVATGLIGFVVGYALVPKSDRGAIALAQAPFVQKYPNAYYAAGFFGCACVLVAVGLWYYHGMPPILYAVSRLASGDSPREVGSFMSYARIAYTKGGWVDGRYGTSFGAAEAMHAYLGDNWQEGGYRGEGLVNEVMRIGWRLLVGFGLVACYHWRKPGWVWTTVAAFVCCVVFVGGAGVRGPVITSVIFLLVVVSFVVRVRIRRLILPGAISFLLLCLWTLPSSRGYRHVESGRLLDLVGQLAYRITMGNGVHDVQIIELVHEGVAERRWGMFHLGKFVSSLPGVRIGVPLGFYIAEHIGAPEGVVCSGGYLGRVYADFGFLGVFPIYILLGACVGFVERFVFRREKEILSLVMTCMILFCFGRTYAGGLSAVASNLVVAFAVRGLFHVAGALGARAGREAPVRRYSTPSRGPGCA